MDLKGDMNLQVSDPGLARIKIALLPPTNDFGHELQFKQHPNVGKFVANKERVIALKDPSRQFPVNQSLAVLKWRYTGKDESYVPLSSTLVFFLHFDAHHWVWVTNGVWFVCSQLLANAIERRDVRCEYRI